jgi:predicted RecB family nuclease
VRLLPEPNEHCELCAWRVPCDVRRRTDDHLCLVAGISKIQMGELRGHAVATLASLAQMPLPLAWKPDRGVAASYERVREQARIQVRGRVEGKALYETLPVIKDLGAYPGLASPRREGGVVGVLSAIGVCRPRISSTSALH